MYDAKEYKGLFDIFDHLPANIVEKLTRLPFRDYGLKLHWLLRDYDTSRIQSTYFLARQTCILRGFKEDWHICHGFARLLDDDPIVKRWFRDPVQIIFLEDYVQEQWPQLENRMIRLQRWIRRVVYRPKGPIFARLKRQFECRADEMESSKEPKTA